MKKYTHNHIQILEQNESPGWKSDRLFTEEKACNVLRFHKSLPMYKETELKILSSAAAGNKVKEICIKDESARFGLKAFKGLGGSYAVFRCLCERLGLDYRTADFEDLNKEHIREACRDIEFVTATDGNHGKGLAWAARMFGCKSHVFMPKGTVEARRKAIEEAGASTVVITDVNYDKTVARASRFARERGWILVQDTSWEGYETLPAWIMEGYLTLAKEACDQMKEDAPTHVFLQAGVGAMAGSVAGYLLNRYESASPVITIVEPDTVACVFLSAEVGDGEPHSIEGDPVTIMAGLNCGTPCGLIWPVLRDGPSFYCACPDNVTKEGMRAYAHPVGTDPAIISGESGAVTYGLILNILKDEELKKLWKIDESSVILLINTEGDTDPEAYEKTVK